MRSRNPLVAASLSLVLIAFTFVASRTALPQAADADGKLLLLARSRVETSKGSGRYHTLTRTLEWDAKKTCIVVCDMWDKHWCPNSTRRVGEMAPRMNDVLTAARKRGVFILHCPSDTMEFYADAPQRKLAQAAPKAETKVPLQRWIKLIQEKEGNLPIDDSDGGCDCEEPVKNYRAWTRQIATLEIAPDDAITDSDEAYHLMRQRGIENVIVLGVHTNMCVLGRPFSIRQMVGQGMNVLLMRDMTDTMYNPARRPFVHHATGTDLVVEHIEKHWCPSITSVDFLGGKEFRFTDDARKHLVIFAAEDEYKTEVSLPEFAKTQLGRDFRVSLVYADEKKRDELPGAEVITEADALLVSVRRRGLPADRMEALRRFVAAGKPVIGIRTASHAFAPFANRPLPKDAVFWPEFDREVFGGNYTGHHSNGKEEKTFVRREQIDHEILAGLDDAEFASSGSLYKTSPLAEGTTVLLMGRAGKREPHEPVAWTFTRADGGRSFYTSLGHVDDFQSERYQRLLKNGIFWAMGMKTPAEPSPAVEKKKEEPKKDDAKKTTSKETKPLSPAESAKMFDLPDDLQMQLVLSEPEVKQPVFMTFDDRGRMWVVQYLQYPFPAGLKMLSRDNYWRTRYDKVPPAPPNHFVGRDKITIHEDTDGDGRYDKHRTFVDGLNMATAVAPGRGGVWVLNAPYLLFYPDRNRDDVPDGDPEVHLEGFGLEDTHSLVNSLCFGPDGWIYAAQGSTVTAAVKRPGVDQQPIHSMGQLIWRYHPEKKIYEIFSEGGGNAFGVEIDSQGRIFSGHNGGDTRGFHYVQGGYLQKGFTKHGPLSNPFAFGFFPAMKNNVKIPRFTHNFILYNGGSLPERYRGMLFGVAPLLQQVNYSQLLAERSTFHTQDVGNINSRDKWFRPVDIKLGPDGAIYVADWYDSNVSHLRNSEGEMDASNGRIYRIQAKDHKSSRPRDFAALSGEELIACLSDANRWTRRTALRVLGDRRDAALLAGIDKSLDAAQGPAAHELLWALNACGGFNAERAGRLLDHADPQVRLWTVRLLGDERQTTSAIATKLATLSATEANLEVRVQLACSARRLPAEQGLPIVRGLMLRDEDADDPRQPLLLWWAMESFCGGDRDRVIALFQDAALWNKPLASSHLLQRLMKRFAMTDNRADLLLCAKLLQLAPNDETAKLLIQAFEEASAGRSLAALPEELVQALAARGGGSIVLGLRTGKPEATAQALRAIADGKGNSAERLRYIQIFGEIVRPECVEPLLDVAASDPKAELRTAALASLQRYDREEIAARVLQDYPKYTAETATAAQSLLAGRREWANRLVEAVDAKRIDAASVSINTVRRLLLHNDPRIHELVQTHWGDVRRVDEQELKRQTAHYAQVVESGLGSPYEGRKLFTAQCGKCHTLFGDGGKIGPDLTSYKRDDLATMLRGVVSPSAEIREGFENFLIAGDDGRVMTGLIVDRDNQVVVMRGAEGEPATFRRDAIEEMRALPQSLMPEGLLKDYSEQQIRDLFAYLRSTQPLNN